MSLAGRSPRLLIYSQVFAPMVGGIETMSQLLAEGMARRGFAVRVQTPIAGASLAASYDLVRTKSRWALLRNLLWADTYVISGMTLVPMLIGVILGKRTIVVHHTWLRRMRGDLLPIDRIKRLLVRFAENLAVSRALAADIPASTTTIENCYDDLTFAPGTQVPDRDIIFAGRLVSDKGAHVLVEAIRILQQHGLTPTATIAGSGPEEQVLKHRVAEYGLSDTVAFLGSLPPAKLADAYRRHRLLVCPSVWREPFGLVALEAAACGCYVIGTADGGLADAIGPCGTTVPRSDPAAMAEAIRISLEGGTAIDPAARDAHLARHTPESVFSSYAAYIARGSARSSR